MKDPVAPALKDQGSQRQATSPRKVREYPPTSLTIRCRLFDRQQDRQRAESSRPSTGPQTPCFHPLRVSQCMPRIFGSRSCTRCRQEDGHLLLEAPREPPLALVLRRAPISATSRSIPSSV